jgi:trehalose 6-phosphate synthase/phosphatase
MSNGKRLFIVSNRLPVCVTREDNRTQIKPAAGGLVSAIQSYLQKENTAFSEVHWAGVPGCTPTVWNEAANQLDTSRFNYVPVMVYKEQYEKYYNGFSNSVLWPLFHYFPSYAEYDSDEYDHYKLVNEHFAEILARCCREGDTVWIHDYHLLPLASMLRKEIPNLTIGFFLHIPFPSYELFRLIPKKWQREILKGMLGADLIGFHTIDYASHFLESIQKILGLDNDRNIIRYQERLLKVDVFPISIDFNLFHEAFDKKEVVEGRNILREKMNGWKIIFSVDRLDYTKGLQNRLKAFKLFLEQNPHYLNKVVFIINIVPSRDTIPKYAERKRMIDELISQINSKIGNLHWQPVIYRYSTLSFDDMVTLYTSCDLALVTPMRDGMNLVAKEFVASRKDKKGVLLISEMAGAARELNTALLINPNDVQEMAEKIKDGLEMSEEEQATRLVSMQQRIASYDVNAWAADFIAGLQNIKQKQQTFQEIFLDDFSKRMIFDSYRNAGKRLLLLDYDGTLVSFTSAPEKAVPEKSLLNLLNELSQKEDTEIYLISGRNSSWLDRHFSSLPINLIAEHGARCKLKNAEWQTEVQTHSEWKEQVCNIMEMFARRCPQTFVEEKEFSLVWHYRNADKEQGELRAQELISELTDFIRNGHLQVLGGNKIVEVRNRGIDKGTAIKKILRGKDYDFIFAVGDDKTDEDMFKTLVGRKNCFTIKVGPNASYAQYNLLKPQMVVSLLEGLNHLPVRSLVQ